MTNATEISFAARLSAPREVCVFTALEIDGRLGVPHWGGLSLLQGIGDVPVCSETETRDSPAADLLRDRGALIPLVARSGLRGPECVFPNEEESPQVEKHLTKQSSLRDVTGDSCTRGMRENPLEEVTGALPSR